MDDNEQPQPEQPAQPDPAQQPLSFTPLVPPKNKLEELPPEIRIELDAFLKRDGNVNKAKTSLEKKWLGQTDILPCAYATYKSYYDLHRIRLFKERETEVRELQQTQQDLLGFKDMAADITEGNPVSFRSRYQELLEFIEDRIAAVVEQQSHGYASPQYEVAMNQWIKTKKDILEKMEDYKDDVDEKRHKLNIAFFEKLSHELMKVVFDTYKKVNNDVNLAQFKAELKADVIKIVERTQTEYDRDINDL